MDVTPRPGPGRVASRRTWTTVVAIALVIGSLGFIALRALDEATLFFRNADEAVADRESLGDRRFRLQGTVVDGSVAETVDGVEFVVTYDDVDVDVAHTGDPPDLFQPDVPVVLEGRWQGEVFASDRIIVKHSSEYQAENSDRLQEAEEPQTSAPDAPANR